MLGLDELPMFRSQQPSQLIKKLLYASRLPSCHNVDDGGHNKERERTCVSRGGGRWGIDIINIPSAAIYITQHGSVAMVIATGQLMQK